MPLTGVEVMGGLLNRRNTFLDAEGAPLLLGLHAVGDAHTCTNPLYGRGCSLGMVQAQSLVDALGEFGTDHPDRARAYEAASEAEIIPWYRASVTQDRMSRQTAAAERAAADHPMPEVADPSGPGPSEADDSDAEVTRSQFLRSLLRDGLFPAMRVDPVVLRAFLRMFNLLGTTRLADDEQRRDRPGDGRLPGQGQPTARADARTRPGRASWWTPSWSERDWTDRLGQPPATAGMIETVSPSGTAVPVPSR